MFLQYFNGFNLFYHRKIRLYSLSRTISSSSMFVTFSFKHFRVTTFKDGAALSFKDKMKLFRESGTAAKVTNQTKKISLVSAQDVKSIKADESRKVDLISH